MVIETLKNVGIKAIEEPKAEVPVAISSAFNQDYTDNLSDQFSPEQEIASDGDSDQITAFRTYLHDIKRYPLLKRDNEIDEERILGERIFDSKLSLLALRSLSNYLPAEKKAKVDVLLNGDRGKKLLSALSSEIQYENGVIEGKEEKGESLSFTEIDFREKVTEKNKSTEEKIKELLSTEDPIAREQKASEFAEREIISFYHNNEAFDLFYRSNLRLVVSIAKKSIGQGVPILDLIQEGNVCLIRSVARFDFRRGSSFATFATPSIKFAVLRAVKDQSPGIKLPIHVSDNLNVLEWEREKMEQDTGRPVSTTQAVKMLGKNTAVIRSAIASKKTFSTDALIDREFKGSPTIGTLILDRNENVADKVEQKIFEEHRKKEIEILLSQLSKKEMDVIRLRLGLDGQPQTLEEIGQEFGVTRERIRQIEVIAKKKLKILLQPMALEETI